MEGEIKGAPEEMKKDITYIVLVVLLVAAGMLTGCGDGRNSAKPVWSTQLGISAGTTTVSPQLTCVSVIGYKPVQGSGGDLTSGNFTTGTATRCMQTIMDGKSASSTSTDCVEIEISKLKEGGSEFYWGNRTYLLTRNKIPKRPKDADVKMVDYTDCAQVQAAACLLTD